MPFQKKFAGAADPDNDAALDAGVAASPSAPASLSAPPPTKKAFGGPRTMTAGGGGGSKFGGFRKGGGVMNFKGGKR
jgi:hypothetical protein